MEQTDFSFMKTGFDLVNNEEETKQNIVAMVTAFTEKACRTACIYIKHSPRNVVTLEDIKRSMMLEVFMFMKRPGIMEETAAIRHELFVLPAEDDIMEGDYDFDIAEENECVFCESKCECALCKCVNKIYERWENWQPSNPWEVILKTHVDKMDSALPPSSPSSSPSSSSPPSCSSPPPSPTS